METMFSISTSYPAEKNKVMREGYKGSLNFYASDKILQHYLKNHVSAEGLDYMQSRLDYTGIEAAGKMNGLSLLADKNGPEVVKRNFWGETINEIRFHPAYWELMDVAVKSEMFRVKWEPGLRSKFGHEGQRLGFASGYLYAMSECGQYCPLCMTDGVARLIDIFCDEDDKERLLPHIYTQNTPEFYTGAMYLTEKTGGSDVGASITTATHHEGKTYKLNGEKWFCSNANADLIFALARTDEGVKGTKGLSIFLVEKNLPDGQKNPIEVIRLKDKLGVRSMASAECYLTDTQGMLVGNEFEGFKVMIEMINLSRLYNSVAALGTSRRALVEAYQFISQRKTFGKTAIEHALIRTKLTELGALNVANFYLVWRAIKSLDLADAGDEKELQLFRIINPMTKKWSAEKGVYITRESMEMMGGLGYIEDGVMPKLMRDMMVLPIWEGSGNIIILDMLRAMAKSEGFKVLCGEILKSASKNTAYSEFIQTSLQALIKQAGKLKDMPQDIMEASAKPFFEKLTSLYQISLLVDEWQNDNDAWIAPALKWLVNNYTTQEAGEVTPLSVEEVKGLLAWEF
ncbi:MAG TPA: acyl-CoA dehydrogenase family protein [Chitinophagales bacterium]|nr:acyl-CoA dehydrogenase family protein [Chitinophagales bacterium]